MFCWVDFYEGKEVWNIGPGHVTHSHYATDMESSYLNGWNFYFIGHLFNFLVYKIDMFW